MTRKRAPRLPFPHFTNQRVKSHSPFGRHHQERQTETSRLIGILIEMGLDSLSLVRFSEEGNTMAAHIEPTQNSKHMVSALVIKSQPMSEGSPDLLFGLVCVVFLKKKNFFEYFWVLVTIERRQVQENDKKVLKTYQKILKLQTMATKQQEAKSLKRRRGSQDTTVSERTAKKCRTAVKELEHLHAELKKAKSQGSGSVSTPGLEDPKHLMDTLMIRDQALSNSHNEQHTSTSLRQGDMVPSVTHTYILPHPAPPSFPPTQHHYSHQQYATTQNALPYPSPPSIPSIDSQHSYQEPSAAPSHLFNYFPFTSFPSNSGSTLHPGDHLPPTQSPPLSSNAQSHSLPQPYPLFPNPPYPYLPPSYQCPSMDQGRWPTNPHFPPY